ncbi:MAG: hypothetical protein AB7I37_17700 [Pirellulales bacterium]
MNKEQQLAKLQLEMYEATRRIGQGEHDLVEERMELEKKIDILVAELPPQLIGTICVAIRSDGKVHIYGSNCSSPFFLSDTKSSDLGSRLFQKIRDMRSEFVRELVWNAEKTDPHL